MPDLVGRFVALLRMWAAFLAGAHRMDWRRFLAFSAAGGIVWATLMGLVGYTFGNTFLTMGGLIAWAPTGLALLLMAAVLLALRRSEHRLQRAADRALGAREQDAA